VTPRFLSVNFYTFPFLPFCLFAFLQNNYLYRLFDIERFAWRELPLTIGKRKSRIQAAVFFWRQCVYMGLAAHTPLPLNLHGAQVVHEVAPLGISGF
jgi:hypothetical protein